MGVVRLQPGACCGCGAPACNVEVCVGDDCGFIAPGATVTIGAASATTGPDGCAVLDIGAAGTKTVQVTAAGYQVYSEGSALGCGDAINANLSGFGGCCGIPEHMTLTDANGSHAFDYSDNNFGGGGWLLSYYPSVTPTCHGPLCDVNQTAPVQVVYQGTCSYEPFGGVSQEVFRVVRSWAACGFFLGNDPSGLKNYVADDCLQVQCVGNPRGCECSKDVAPLAGHVNPFSLSMSMPSDPFNFMPDPVGGGIVLS
jgi:hypothetical protein